MNRRQVLRTLGLGSLFASTATFSSARSQGNRKGYPVVLSTWYNQAVAANNAAWNILGENGPALDAVEQGVMVSENDWNNCCVGLGGNPDRDGKVTLDACIMNHESRCGSVACIERIKNPIHIARMVMEKTPHVMLVGDGAQKFALENGMKLEDAGLSPHAQDAYNKWQQKNEYRPKVNIEKGKGPATNDLFDVDTFNHDTIGMIALDVNGNLGGACTTSGLGFKMSGRVGDSPIIGAGLYVDNEVGAAVATGHGEEVIRISGSFLVVEMMRQGYSPEMACRIAVERIMKKTPRKPQDIQVGFLALNTQGEYGSYCIQKGFDYAVRTPTLENPKEEAKHIL